MTPPAPDALRAVAAQVHRRGLDGRTFPAAVGSTQARYGADAPDDVRRLAAVVRFRHPHATPAEVAALLTYEAERAEAGAVV